MSETPIYPGPEYLPASQKEEVEKKKKRRDFWLGLILSVVLNLALVALIILAIVLIQFDDVGADPANVTGIVAGLMYVLPWILNIAAIVFALVKRRPAIVLGFLASYALAFALSLIAGLIFMVICFASSGGTL